MSARRIVRLGRDGDGLAADGTAFPGALPGETVERDGEKLRILEPAAIRVKPPCRHAGSCGGCALQHADPGFLARWKRDLIVEALARRGIETAVAETIAAPPRSRRRAAFTAMRTKKSALLGFRQRRSHLVVEIADCLLVSPAIQAALPALRAIGALAASRKREVKLWVTTSESGLDVAVEDGKELDLVLREAAAAWAEETDVARLSWNGEAFATRRPPIQRFGGVAVAPPPGAFLQAAPEGEAALIEQVLEGVGGAKRVEDLFAGCGTFSLPLARGAEVHAVEDDTALTAALEKGWRGGEGLRRVTVESRDLFRRPLLPEELAGFDAAVFDPPRAGAEVQTAELARTEIPAIVGVSCNPVSFARDAAVLVGAGWSLDRVTPVDQFLWSPHVELVGRFLRR